MRTPRPAMDSETQVPVSELASRQDALARALADAEIDHAMIQYPVDLHYLCGGRQTGSFWIPAHDAPGSVTQGGDGPVQLVRRSLSRAVEDAGGGDAPHEITSHPSLRVFGEYLRDRGARTIPAMQLDNIPHSYIERFRSSLSSALDGPTRNVSPILHNLRETKSPWELEQMRISAEVQSEMFTAVMDGFQDGDTELDIAGIAEHVSRSHGYGGVVNCRRYPMTCDRAVVVSGRSGGIPSFFDAAVGGHGPHPGAGMGSSSNTIRRDEPVLVDLLHAHAGYIVDMTRMFVAGSLDDVWHERLDHTLTIESAVVESLGRGDTCVTAWREGLAVAEELGVTDHLMGQKPVQSRFLGHSVGLELDETPVIAEGFDRPLPIGGVMAIEPKLIYDEGAIGIEDTWLRTSEGLEPLSRRDDWAPLVEW